MDKCLNCGAELTGKYCSNCGQERITGKLEVKHLFKDVTHGIFHWESSILKTFKELLLRPGKFLRSYIEGIRKPYVKPFSYFIFIQTLYVLVFHWLSDKYFAFMNATVTTGGDMTETMAAKIHNAQHLVSVYINYLNFAMPLFYAFFIMIFFKKKTGINYAESIVISLYVMGNTLLFGIVLMLFSVFSEKIWGLRLIINLIYMIFVMVQFSGYSKLQGIIRGFFSAFLSYISYIIIFGSLIVIYLLFFAKA